MLMKLTAPVNRATETAQMESYPVLRHLNSFRRVQSGRSLRLIGKEGFDSSGRSSRSDR
jgi:hypothetical protein